MIPKGIISYSIMQHKSDKHYRAYKTYDQLVELLFGQLKKCVTLQDITIGLGINEKLFSDLDISQSPAKSTMPDSNEKWNWKVLKQFIFHY